MAVERVAVRRVEDESGKGFFETTIEEGGVERKDRVPAIYTEGNYYDASKVYIKQQLDTGTPVVAYRAGKRGLCVVAVNHGVVAVETTRRFDASMEAPKRSMWTDLNPAHDSKQFWVDSYGQGENTPKLEFTGVNRQTGAPIKITVGFVR